MSTNEQAALERERAIDATRHTLDLAMAEFAGIILKEGASSAEVQVALLHVHTAFTTHVNACEVSIADTALLGAHRNSTWISTKVDSVVAVLHFIAHYWTKIEATTNRFEIANPREVLSPGAYAAMQRLVAKHRPAEAEALRAQFAALRLPTDGFDQPEAIQSGTASIEWKDGEPVRADGLESQHAKDILASRAHLRVGDSTASGPVSSEALSTIAQHLSNRPAAAPKPSAWSIIKTKLIESPVLVGVSLVGGLSVVALGWWLGQAGVIPFVKPAPAAPTSGASTGGTPAPR